MSRPEFSEAATANPKQATTEAEAQMARAKERAASFLFGAQKLMLEECVILGNEFLDRTQTEMHLFAEFASKLAGAHSVRDLRTMYEECSKHQLEFIRRDCDQVFKNGERVIEGASSLFRTRPLS
ncbi:hypothetical protein ACVW1A_000081 [Bradyrhizobium sp. LB1.3]